MNGRLPPIRLTAFVFLLGFMFPSLCPAQDGAFERLGNYGLVDWIDQRVSATGVGVAREGASPAQARVLAERAALTVARRNLLEAVRGIHIDSKTTVENFMVADDAIVARVSGEVKFAQVDRIEHLSDGTVQTTVSMPLTGGLGAIVLGAAAGVSTAPSLLKRVEALEKRVQDLEERMARVSRTAVEQKETIEMFRRFVEAWTAYVSTRPLPAAASGTDIAELEARLGRQEGRLSELARKLDALSLRIDGAPSAGAPAPDAAGGRPQTPYTGLVIDARGTGFRPCLKPEVFAAARILYPDTSVDLQAAIRNGYVRYYRQIERAQQSDRVGSLPITVRAKGTYGGDRGLEIDPKAVEQINAPGGRAAGFLRKCRVVIVF